MTKFQEYTLMEANLGFYFYLNQTKRQYQVIHFERFPATNDNKFSVRLFEYSSRSQKRLLNMDKESIMLHTTARKIHKSKTLIYTNTTYIFPILKLTIIKHDHNLATCLCFNHHVISVFIRRNLCKFYALYKIILVI